MTDEERAIYLAARRKHYTSIITDVDGIRRLIGSVNAEIMKPNAIPVRATVLCGGVLELNLLGPEDAA